MCINVTVYLICLMQLINRFVMMLLNMLENMLRLIVQTLQGLLQFILEMCSLLPVCIMFFLSSKMKCFVTCGKGGCIGGRRSPMCDCIMVVCSLVIVYFAFHKLGVWNTLLKYVGYEVNTPKKKNYFDGNTTDNESSTELEMSGRKFGVDDYFNNPNMMMNEDKVKLNVEEKYAPHYVPFSDDVFDMMAPPESVIIAELGSESGRRKRGVKKDFLYHLNSILNRNSLQAEIPKKTKSQTNITLPATATAEMRKQDVYTNKVSGFKPTNSSVNDHDLTKIVKKNSMKTITEALMSTFTKTLSPATEVEKLKKSGQNYIVSSNGLNLSISL